MAISFPLSRDDFLSTLFVQNIQLFIHRQDQMIGLGGGEILKSELAPALWRGAVQLAVMEARPAAAVEALLAMLEVPGRAFEVCSPDLIGPVSDPMGAGLLGFAPTIHAIDEPGSTLRLAGLPIGYEITPGDMLSFSYGTNPVRQALHRFVEGDTASAIGQTAALTVVPHIRPGALVGATVELVRPWCKGVMIPGSVSYGSRVNGITSGLGFQFQQSLR